MPQIVRPDHPKLNWQGAISFDHTDEWVMPWRLPYEELALFPPDALRDRAAMPAGVRISFRSDTGMVSGNVVPWVGDPYPGSPIDLYCDGVFAGSAPLDGQDGFHFDGLPGGEKLVELWLPQHGEFRLRSLALSDGATVEAYQDDRPKWVTYGSSITHCRTAESPSQTWPAIAARSCGLNLTCLGYGGGCHLEPMVARMIRELPADYISLKLGINVHNADSMNIRTFRPAVIGFVHIVREKHPDTPLVVISPIFSPPRETAENIAGFSLTQMRVEVAEAVDAMQGRGDRNLHYVDGMELFGPDLVHMLPDELHPDAEGYKVMGRNVADKVVNRFFVGAQAAVV
jgi:hypothetical protein